MAKLTPGVLLKLLDAMNSGVKPTSEYRNSLLQVTDIMPVDLDEKDLWPKQGFSVKVLDSSYSIYVSLPSDLILSNEIQLGQFVFVEKLEPGSPVPVAKGVKPVPGRQLFVGMPEPLLGFNGKGENVNEKVVKNLDHISNLNPKLVIPRKGLDCASPVNIRSVAMNTNMRLSVARRSSWVTGPKREYGICGSSSSPMVLKPTLFDHCTPVKRGSGQKISSIRRASLSRLNESPVVLKRCVASSMVKVSEDKSRSRIIGKDAKTLLTSPFNSAVGKASVTPPSSQSTRVASSPHSSSKTRLSFSLPQQLSLLGKEAIQQQERAQKNALQALRNSSATETLVWSLKTLSSLTKSADHDDPTDCFDQFLEFHNQIGQAITNMVSIKAATETTNKELKGTQILHDTMNNNKNTSMRKYPSYTSQQKSTVLGKQLRPSGSLNETIKLGKQIEKEAGDWFMEFLEKSLEKGMKKSKLGGTKVPQLLVKKVMNWVEIEQCDSSKRPVHPKAIEIARKLRIKLRNS